MSLYPEGVTELDIDRAFDEGEEAEHWCPICEARRPGFVFDRREFVCDVCGETTHLDDLYDWDER